MQAADQVFEGVYFLRCFAAGALQPGACARTRVLRRWPWPTLDPSPASRSSSVACGSRSVTCTAGSLGGTCTGRS